MRPLGGAADVNTAWRSGGGIINLSADVVAWLLSPASSYVTGSVVTVSGGR